MSSMLPGARVRARNPRKGAIEVTNAGEPCSGGPEGATGGGARAQQPRRQRNAKWAEEVKTGEKKRRRGKGSVKRNATE